MGRCRRPQAEGPPGVSSVTDGARTGGAFDLPWGVGAVSILVLLLLCMGVQAGGWIGPAMLGEATLSMHVSVAASGLLAIAAALYVVLEDARINFLGIWASRFALFGSLGLAAGSLLRAAEVHWLSVRAFEYQIGLEAPGLIVAVAVLLYLRIEQAWQSRRAGALVVALALVALGLDVWLMATVEGVPSALGRVMDGHLVGLWHLGGKVGVAASAALVTWSLIRRHVRALAPAIVERIVRAAMNVGLSGFTLALLSSLALAMVPGPGREAVTRLSAGLAVWLCFSLLYVVWRRAAEATPKLSAWIFATLLPAAAAYHALGARIWL